MTIVERWSRRCLLPTLLLGRQLARAASSSEDATCANVFSLRPGPADPSAAGEKTLLLVRHAEGWHNKDARELPNWKADALGLTMKYWDARLTPEGERQCAALAASLARAAPPDLVAVSPLTRTLQTATLTFGAAYGAGPAAGGPPFLATELARERIAAHTCDGRRSRAEQAAEFAHVDFSELESDEDALFHSAKEDEPTEFASERCFARAGELLAWLHGRPEQRIAVVSHWVFLRHLLTRFAADASLPENFGNAEMREVALVPTNRTACYAGS